MNEDVLRKISYGLYIVSTLDGKRLTGCTANSSIQINSSPNTIIVSINKSNYTNECINKTGKFAVSILSEASDPKIIGNFGFQSGKDVNKFDNIDYEIKEDIPVVKDSCGYMVCNVINKMETSTHTIFLGEIIDGDIFNYDVEPMTYSYYHKVVRAAKPKADNKETKKYVCTICGYIYEGDELPENYICPICKQGADKFKEVK